MTSIFKCSSITSNFIFLTSADIIQIIIPYPANSSKIGLIRPINSKRRRRIVLFPIDVKFRTMTDYIFSQSLVEVQNDY